jgi:hypothetical protein
LTNEDFEKIEKMINDSVGEDELGVLTELVADCLSTFYNNLRLMDDDSQYLKEELTIMFFNKLLDK